MWETIFGKLPDLNRDNTISTRPDEAATSNIFADDASPQDENFTHVDLRSTRPHKNENPVPNEKIHSECTIDNLDDQN